MLYLFSLRAEYEDDPFMYLFLSLLWILLVFLVSTVAFGHWLVSLLSGKFSQLESLIFGTMLAIVVLSCGFVLTVSLFGSIGYWLVLLISTLIGATHCRKRFSQIRQFLTHLLKLDRTTFRTKQWLTVLFTSFASVSLASTVFLSGVQKDGGLQFQELHDSSWHLALIESLQKQIPPTHPSFPSVDLQNYHYFYDVFLAAFAQVTQVSASILYFQFFPLVLAVLLVGSAYILGSKLFSHSAGLWLVFFTAFGGSFAYLIPLFLPGQSWGESSFWVSQTFIMMVNPQIMLTLTITFVVLFLLAQKELNTKGWLALILLVGASIGFKSYAWVILFVIVGVYLLVALLRTKKIRFFWLGATLGLISVPFVWLITGFKTGTFFYHPLWYLDSMVESPDRLNHIQWKFLEDHYRSKENWPRVWEIKLKELVVFYGGNLGTRILFLLLAIPALYRKIPSKAQTALAVAALGFVFSSVFPLLFLQTGIVWNSIQFWYYTLAFANVGAAVALAIFLQNRGLLITVATILVIVAATIPTYIFAVHDKLTGFQTIAAEEVSLLRMLEEDSKTLVCPSEDSLYHTLLIPAYSATETYLAMPVQLEIMENDMSMVASYEEIFEKNDIEALRTLVKEEDVKYLLCSDERMTEFVAKVFDGKKSQESSTDDWSLYQLN
ncbi:MAG: hypothetical protein WDZ94_04360 [Patescibacteria group bacterium]